MVADTDTCDQIKKYEESDEVILLQNYRPDTVKKSPNKKSEKRVYNPDQKETGDYYYFIGQGNNAELVENIMRRRQNWTSTRTLLSLPRELDLSLPMGTSSA
jgi:hypothetical protein